MDHVRRDYDKAFRRIQLYSSGTPKFVDFTSEKQSIPFQDKEQVLELLLEDGKTELLPVNRERITVFYCPHGMNQIRIQIHGQSLHLNEITARMWARKGSSHVCYKLPPVAKCEGNCVYVEIPGGSSGVELFGDVYFNHAFDLTAQ